MGVGVTHISRGLFDRAVTRYQLCPGESRQSGQRIRECSKNSMGFFLATFLRPFRENLIRISVLGFPFPSKAHRS